MIHTFIHFSCVRYGWKMVVGEEDMARGVPFFKTPVAHCSYRSINPHKSAGIISFPRRSYSLIPRVYPPLPLFDISHESFVSFTIPSFAIHSDVSFRILLVDRRSKTKNRIRGVESESRLNVAREEFFFFFFFFVVSIRIETDHRELRGGKKQNETKQRNRRTDRPLDGS